MLNPWLDFLSQAGATIESETVINFSSLETEAQACQDRTVIADLSHLDLLAVAGEEAKTFLQGQLSCDFSQVTEDSLQLGSYCTPKGRMITSFRAFNISHTYYLLMEPGLFQPSQQVLGKYIIFSKAEIKNARNDFITLGLAGPKAEALLSEICPLPADINTLSQEDGIVCARIAGPTPVSASSTQPGSRFILFCPIDIAKKLWQQLSQHATPVGQNAWHLLDILAGYGQVETSTVEQFLPHNLNYQSIGAISFNKGCFTGQEIIARMHYRGQLKSRLYLLASEIKSLPKAGSGLFIKQGDQFKRHGELVNIAIAGKKAGAYDCRILALLPTTNPEQTPLFLSPKDEQGLTIKVLKLPYKVAEE